MSEPETPAESRAITKHNDDSSSSSSYDASLDFYSTDFDPLKALRSNKSKPPDPSTAPCDNLAKYTSSYSWEDPVTKVASAAAAVSGDISQPSTSAKSADACKQGDDDKAREELPQRRWLPHQLPVKRERKEYQIRNILTCMDRIQGPLQRIFQCIQERTKIKVWTRNDRGIRGYCLGFVTFFDKHWNLSLEDVVEVWTRKKNRKTPAYGVITTNAAEQRLLSEKAKRIFPPISVIKDDRKTETCQRFVNQLIIRGEQISHIVIVVGSADSDQS